MEETGADQHGNVCGADLNTRLAPRCSTGRSWARTIIGADDPYAQVVSPAGLGCLRGGIILDKPGDQRMGINK
jgi:hypothetical protein